MNKFMSKIEFPVWKGEFGWEVMTWAPMCRLLAKGYDEVIVSSFDGMQALYSDFATKFIPNNMQGRSLEYPKNYRCKGKYLKYGNAAPNFDILVHARGIRRKSNINYRYWSELAMMLKPYRFAFIGLGEDEYYPPWPDLRGKCLQHLMNYMRGAKVVVGVSSGIMHLASACGCQQVVWGDSRTYFGETLEKRYKETWNPFNTKVGWLTAEDWQPQPEKIFEKVKELLSADSAEKRR